MHLVIDEQTLRQLIRPIVAEIVAGIVEAERRGRPQVECRAQSAAAAGPVSSPNPSPILYATKEASKFLGVSDRQLYQWEKAGLVKAIRLGRLVKYRRDELERIAREGVVVE
jgi:excisionase family DNA binding protein